MKNVRLVGWISLLFVILLAGCGNKSGDNSASDSDSNINNDISQSQEMTTEQLHQYFQQAFDTKGNILNTSEQLALELSELKSLIADTAHPPESYEAQYQEWRTTQTETLLENLQNEYDQIVSSASLYDGIHSGVAYADYIDFNGDGVNELLMLSVSPEIDDSEINWSCSIQLYSGISGHAEAYNTETIICPYLYRSDYDATGIDLVQKEGQIYVHVYNTEGRNVEDTYYGIENNSTVIADETFAFEGSWSSNNQEISFAEYEAIHAKYTDVIALVTNNSSIPVQNRGILPELPSETQKRLAFLETLENCNPKYACLADMDGDGTEDLLIATEEEWSQIFRVYLWNGAEIQSINLTKGVGLINGVCQEKTTGIVYVCYSSPVDSMCAFERVSEVLWIDSYTEEINRFEEIADLDRDYPQYETIIAVRRQLIND